MHGTKQFFKSSLLIVIATIIAFGASGFSQFTPTVHALTETISTANVDANGTHWRAAYYTPTETGTHTFTITKVNPNALTGSSLRIVQGSVWVASNTPVTGTTQTLTANLAAGVEHKVSFWTNQEATDYTIVVDSPDPQGGGGTIITDTISTGIRDDDSVLGSRWGQETWTAPITGDVEFNLAWTNSGSLRFSLREQVSNNWLAASPLNGTSSQSKTIAVTQGTTYKISVWATRGWGDHTMTATYDAGVIDNGEPTREVHTGRGDSTGVDGDITASFPFVAPGSGTIYVSLNYEKDTNAELHLFLKNANGDEVSSTETVWIAKGMEENVVAGNYTIEVFADSGVADWHMEVYYEPTIVEEPDAPVGAPNIVVINTDDQRADSLQHLPKIMNWFGNGGVTFTNGFVTTPSCCPSRAGLFTGQYNHNNGVVGQHVPELNHNESVQRQLKEAGYNTAFAGKFVHFWPQQLTAPFWDNWTYFKGGYYDSWINSDGDNNKEPGNTTIHTFNKGIEYIDAFKAQDDARPWFLHLTPVVPHKPATPEPQYENAAVLPRIQTPNIDEADRSDKPTWMQNRNRTAAIMEPLRLNMVRSLYTLDDQVDNLMNHLQTTGELSNTLVILTSDNGYMWGEHLLDEKFTPYDVSIRVPFLAYWQGQLTPGTTDDRWVSNIDISPTILAAAGLTIPSDTDGVDIFSGYDRTNVYTEYFRDAANSSNIPGWKSIRNDSYIYTEWYDTDETTVIFQEWYDVVNDPYQLTNLLADGNPNNDPSLTAAQALLTTHANCAGATCRP